MNKQRFFAGAAALGLALALGACSSSNESASTSTPSINTSVDAVHNDADIQFAQQMIPHHEQALEMSALVPSRSQNSKLIALAKEIESAQGPEIEQMNSWLNAWEAPASSSNGHGGHGGNPNDQGMMTTEQMTQLENSSGAAFDRLWLEMMIKHHEGAVVMSKDELANGENPQAKALAQEIISAQETEITQMKKMLATS